MEVSEMSTEMDTNGLLTQLSSLKEVDNMKLIIERRRAQRLIKLVEERKKTGAEVAEVEVLGENSDGEYLVEVNVLADIDDSPWRVIGRKTATDRNKERGVVTLFVDRALPSHEGMRCDECRHPAGTLAIVQNETTGEVRFVGRECLKKFCGKDAELLGLIAQEAESVDGGWPAGFDPVTVPTAKFLTAVLQDMENYGEYRKDYTPRNDGSVLPPTKALAFADASEAVRNLEPVSEDEVAYLEQVREWVATKPATGEFWTNVRNILAGDVVRAKHAGFIACLPNLLRRDEERAAEKEAQAKAKAAFSAEGDKNEFSHVEKGGKVALEALIERVGGFDTQYGWMTVATFRGRDGLAYVWKTTNPPSWSGKGEEHKPFMVGDVVNIRGTVKDKTEYHGTKQTILTRCKMEMLVPAPRETA